MADPGGVLQRTDQGDLWCAGGQCKRVNIGIALVTNPRVLFLDEPTSGLDSYTSNEVMTVVKGLTRTGITICATIHNPTPYCFNLFDRLMILLHGRVVYSGENGARPCSRVFLCGCLQSVFSCLSRCFHVERRIPARVKLMQEAEMCMGVQGRRRCGTLSSFRR